MQNIMTDKVGIFRTGEGLDSAVEELQKLLDRSCRIGLAGKTRSANPELVSAYRLQRMLKVALCVAYGARQRRESRGAHYREDYPQRNDAEWLNRTLAVWQNADDTLPTLSYQTLDIMRMELPPGWRGYGARDYIDHPDTPKRQDELARIRAGMPDADRVTLQAACMPYQHLIPERFRGRNERIDEAF
jgi:fumarate reductase flavoprotein subunit